jgi:hypothetical protein
MFTIFETKRNTFVENVTLDPPLGIKRALKFMKLVWARRGTNLIFCQCQIF